MGKIFGKLPNKKKIKISSCLLDKTVLGWGHEESAEINIESLEWVGPQEKKRAHVPVSTADSRWMAEGCKAEAM